MVRKGQTVMRIPKTIGVLADKGTKLVIRPQKGEVIFVHSKGRYHTVEFTNSSGAKMRESFDGVED